MKDISKEHAIKCIKIMGIFDDEDDGFLSLKELEKLSKSQGIATNELKDILQSLVSDGKLQSDKIGSTVFYWSFPEKKIEEDKKKSDELKWKNKELNDKISALMVAVKEQEEAKEKVGDYEKTKRDEIMKNIEALKVKERDLLDYLNNDNNTSVDEIKDLSAGTKELTVAVNRWTDNIFNMKSWFKRKYPAIEDAQLEKEFRIPSELDYFSPN
ncbi:meiotic nuclear division protein 1 homolog [Chironomus tepperi]|uniref:meiotic nuclear division protein 1 homolog n=1 Tax=Chironomus tepperi TaxID=113505 RepID=UPI00391F0909